MSAAQTAPEVKGGAVPYLAPRDSAAAAEFYVRAFGAEIVNKVPTEDGRMMHVHVYINGGSVMMSDPFPEHGHAYEAPKGFTMHLQVDDIDAWFKRAVDAGCEVTMPVQDMFWGDRYGQVRDPFDVLWAFGQPIKG